MSMNKIKVTAINGSPRGFNSECHKVILMIEKELENRFRKECIDFIELNISDLNVKFCTGCNHCFKYGDCIHKDDMKRIKINLRKSDLIILCSPVYFHNLSPFLVNFIDRLAYWAHQLELIGSFGIIVSSSMSNGNEFVDDYLNKVFDYWGVMNLGNINSVTTNLDNEIGLIAQIDLRLNLFEKWKNNPKLIEVPQVKEQIYTYFDQNYKNIDTVEAKKWKNKFKSNQCFRDCLLQSLNKEEM